jgi:hypothetical protein
MTLKGLRQSSLRSREVAGINAKPLSKSASLQTASIDASLFSSLLG